MIFTPLPLAGAFLVDLELREDERGFFARAWCAEEFARRGLPGTLSQCSVSGNRRRGTLRGLHWQAAPHAETKLVRCVRGAAYDVVVDVRPSSPTHGRWHAVELTADNRRAVLAPPGFAHGFQARADDTELLYLIEGSHHPASARGARWDDPAFGIAWPLPVACMSAADRAWPPYEAGR